MTKQEPTFIRYRFENLQNGQLTEGYIVIDINDYEAEVDAADTEAILLAEKHGGEIVTHPEKIQAQKIKNAAAGAPLVEEAN